MTPLEHNLIELLSYAYTRSARPEKAAALLMALDALSPGQGKVLPALALAQVRCGRAHEALQTLERIDGASAFDAAYHLLRAQALTACERRIEAGEAMSACIAARRASREGAVQ